MITAVWRNVLKRQAVLCGSAPLGFTQKKINEMHSFLISAEGGGWQEKEITIFPNGVSEPLLSFMLERLKSQKTDYILLYICTESAVSAGEKSVWLGGEEIRRNVVESSLADGCGQGVFDSCREMVRDEEGKKASKPVEYTAESGGLR